MRVIIISVLTIVFAYASIIAPQASQLSIATSTDLYEKYSQYAKTIAKLMQEKASVFNLSQTYKNTTTNRPLYIAITFREYLQLYKKSYKVQSQYYYRQLVFYDNLNKINEFNRNSSRKFNMGINQFTDFQPNQFLAHFATLIPQFDDQQQQIQDVRLSIFDIPRFLQTANSVLTEKIDWTCYAGSVDNQGTCGSCYAFASSDALASFYTIYDPNTFFNIKLSVQELISCSDPILENGCKGGLIEYCYDYIIQNGLTSALNYPYESAFSTVPSACDLNKKKAKNKKFITSYRKISSDCTSVVKQLKNQPLAVGINSKNLQFYSQGIFSNSPNSISDHAVLLVGYDPQFGFKIKNMWGKSWGILGYGWVNFVQNSGICSRAVAIQTPLITTKKNVC